MSEEQKWLVYYMVMESPDSGDLKAYSIALNKSEAMEFNDNEKKMLEEWGLDETDLKEELLKLNGVEVT